MVARSLDGYRLAVKLEVTFHRALADSAAEATADEIVRAAAEVLGDQISQGRVPFSAEELADATRKRLPSQTSKVADLQVASLELVRGRQGQQSARSIPSPAASTATTKPPVSRTPAPDAGLGERRSGSLLATPPRTLWLLATSQLQPGASSDEVIGALGLALRDSAAAALLRILMMIDPVAVDRFALFDGRPPVPALQTEICACLAAGLCRTLISDGWPAQRAASLSESAAAEALRSATPQREHIRLYMDSESPVRDLARRAANIIGTPNDAAAIQSVLSPYCEALRVQYVALSREMKRLTPR